MPNFFKSFFSGKSETPESEKQKNDQKNFEIFKYDGLRAQRMGRPDYAVKCFTEALAIQEEFETMGYLSQLYIQMGETAKARELLEKMAAMEPHLTSTFLTLANVCFIQEDYQAMEEAANKAIAIEEANANILINIKLLFRIYLHSLKLNSILCMLPYTCTQTEV